MGAEELRFDNFIWLREKNAVFAYIPKVACTNFKCLCRYMERKTDWLDTKIAHDKKNSGLVYLSSMPNANQILKSNEIKKYAFVRNPYTRVLSAFKNKFEPYNDPQNSYVESYFYNIFLSIKSFSGKDGVDGIVTFNDFLTWLVESGDENTKNEHWQLQSILLCIEEVDFEFIGRFENLEKDATHLLELLGCDRKFPTQKEVGFPATNANSQMIEYYSKDESDLVQRIFADDFEAFNYDI